MIDATVSLYCCILNLNKRLELVRRSNEVAAIVGDIKVDQIKLKGATKKKKDFEKVAKATQKKLKEEKRQNKDKLSHEICKATIKELIKKGEVEISKLTMPVPKDLIHLCYNRTTTSKPIFVNLDGLCWLEECTLNNLAIIYQLNIQRGYRQ